MTRLSAKATPAKERAAARSATTRLTAPVDASVGAPVDAARADGTPPGLKAGHAALRYTTLRLALFLAALLLVWVVAALFHMDLGSQLSKLSMVAIALVVSSAASLVVLSKQRDVMSAGLVARSQRLSRKFNDAAAFEDGEDEG